MPYLYSDEADKLFLRLNKAEPSIILEELNYVQESYKKDPTIPLFEYDTDHNHAWYTLGLAYEKTGQKRNAARCFRIAIEVWPTDADSYVAYSNVEDQLDLISNVLEAGVEQTDDNRIRFNLSNTYLDLGMPDQALEHLRRIKEKGGFGNEVAEQIDKAEAMLSERNSKA